MAKIKKYSSSNGREKAASLWSNDDSKRFGFVTKDMAYDNPAKTRYGFGIDNVGDPNRPYTEDEIRTLLGTLDYGHEGDTAYAGFTPNVATYPGRVAFMDSNGDRLGFLARDERPDGTRYGFGIDNVGSPYRGILDRDVQTPFGTADYGYDGDTVAAGFTPNNYVQAIINLLRGNR